MLMSLLGSPCFDLSDNDLSMTCTRYQSYNKLRMVIKVFTNSLYFFFCFAVVLSSDLTAKVQYCFDW